MPTDFDNPSRFKYARARRRCSVEVEPGLPCGAELPDPWMQRVGACESCLEGSSRPTALGRVQLRGAAERYADEAFQAWEDCRRGHVACAARPGGLCTDEGIGVAAVLVPELEQEVAA
jgi:hypothetical protein